MMCSIIPGSPTPEGDPSALTLVTSRLWPMKWRRAAPDLQLDTATLCRDRDRGQQEQGGLFTSLAMSYQDLCTVYRTGNSSSGFQLLEHVQLSLKTSDARVSVTTPNLGGSI